MKKIIMDRPQPMAFVEFEDGYKTIMRLDEIKVVNPQAKQEQKAKVYNETVECYLNQIVLAFKKNPNIDCVRVQTIPERFRELKRIVDFVNESSIGIIGKRIEQAEELSKKHRCNNCGVCHYCKEPFQKPEKKLNKPICPKCKSTNIEFNNISVTDNKCPVCGGNDYSEVMLNIFYSDFQKKLWFK